MLELIALAVKRGGKDRSRQDRVAELADQRRAHAGGIWARPWSRAAPIIAARH